MEYGVLTKIYSLIKHKSRKIRSNTVVPLWGFLVYRMNRERERRQEGEEEEREERR